MALRASKKPGGGAMDPQMDGSSVDPSKIKGHGSSVDLLRSKAMDPVWIDLDQRPWIFSRSIKI